MGSELLLGDTILNRGGTTNVPEKVLEALGLKPKAGERSKLLWTPAGDEVIVTKGTAIGLEKDHAQEEWNGGRP